MFRFKSLIRVLAVWVGVMAILSITPGSASASEKFTPAGSKQGPEIFVQMGHSDNVSSVAFSPDGKYLASGSGDKSVKIWDVGTGREIRTLRLEQPVFGHNSVKFSPEGRYLASAEADGFIRLWDIAISKELKKFPISISEKLGKNEIMTGSAMAIAFSPNGKSLIVAATVYFYKGGEASRRSKAVINLWDVKTGKLDKMIPVHAEKISDMALSPDGKYALLGCEEPDNTVRLLDVATGKEIRKFAGHSKTVHSVTVSPDGEYVASGSEDKTIVLWHIKSGKKIKTFTNPQRYERFSIAFSPDGKRLIVSGLSEMELWDVSTSQVIATLKGDDLNPWAVIFSPDGLHVAVSARDAVALWDISTVAYGSVYHDNQNTAKLYGYSMGKIRTFGGNVEEGISYFSSSGEKIIVIGSPALREFDRFAGTLRGRKKIGQRYEDGRFFKVEVDDYTQGQISVIDGKKNGAIIRTGYDVLKDKEIPHFQTFSPDGRYAIGQESEGGGRFAYKIIDIRSKKEVSILENPSGGLMSVNGNVIFSPDAKYVIAWYGGEREPVFKLWDVPTGKEIRTFSGHSHFINTAVFTADGGRILSGSMDNTLKLWDTKTGKEIRTFHGHASTINAIDISSDERHVVSGDWGGDIKLWEMDSGREIKTFKGHTNWVQSVLFSPDDKYLVSGSSDGTTRLWDISTGKEISQFISFTDGEWVIITPEGYFNASANGVKHLNVRVGNNVYGIDQYREAFYRPDLVKLALAGGSLKDFRKLADVKQPPSVSIVDTPKNIDREEATVKVKIVDIGGGMGDVRLYLNGSAVVLDSSRGVTITPQDDKAVYKTYTVKLTSGLNTIRAIVFNGDNTMQSNDALHEMTASFKSLTKPSLRALVVGINEFKNPKLKLNYSVADAELFAETLGKGATGLFEKVNIKKLVTQEETTNENIITELKAFQSLNPDDLFVFYVASHGTVDDGEYFLITSNVGSTRTEKLKTDAISQTMFKELISNISATKKLILLDTCNAGALGDAIQVAMLTRGMSEDTAMKVLSRAVGSTILSASTSIQEALEGYQGHGLFTFVLAEGLSGKADKGKTGYIKTTELADYVDNEVPVLAEKIFKKAQYPTISISGQGFPVGKIK